MARFPMLGQKVAAPLLQRLPRKFIIRVGVVVAEDWAERKSSARLGLDIATRANALRLTLFGNDFINRAQYFPTTPPTIGCCSAYSSLGCAIMIICRLRNTAAMCANG